jgi:hypothetical protein
VYAALVSSTNFSFDVEDASFALFDQLRVHEKLGELERYADLDRDVYQATVEEGYKLAREVLHPINGRGDREGCTLDDDGNVTTPRGFREAWKQFCEGGWVGPRADPELGGAGLPAVIGAVLNELFSGSCVAFNMYGGLTGAAARVVLKFAAEKWQRPIAQKMFTGEWTGTMCLTEAGAGSSVGDNRAKAVPSDDPGVYLIEGEKIFITGGDNDLAENIVHLVLARTPGAPSGIKGLSLFLVPKFEFNDDLELGERNGAHVLRLEHKMGIKGSATCVLGLGSKQPCKGWLLGKEHEGIHLMFHMMNEARIGVGVQGLAMGSAAFQYARHYAKERVQGTSMKEIKNPDAKSIAIVEHPDVRRMLMEQKVIVETMRAMCYRLARDFDVAELSTREEERARLTERIDLLVPIIKAMCTDLGFEVAVTAVQIYGGYGYTGEFPVEQLVRDAKIQSIYEGTNGIQALDLMGRKLRIKGGKLFMDWMGDAQKSLETAKNEGFVAPAEAFGKAINAVAASAMHLGGLGQAGKMDAALSYAVPFMQAFGWLVLGLEAVDQAIIAKRKAEAEGDSDFLRGKRLNLDYFAANLLPRTIALAKSVQSKDESCLDPALFA